LAGCFVLWGGMPDAARANESSLSRLKSAERGVNRHLPRFQKIPAGNWNPRGQRLNTPRLRGWPRRPGATRQGYDTGSQAFGPSDREQIGQEKAVVDGRGKSAEFRSGDRQEQNKGANPGGAFFFNPGEGVGTGGHAPGGVIVSGMGSGIHRTSGIEKQPNRMLGGSWVESICS